MYTLGRLTNSLGPTRLTRQQFQELSTDVYDELVRRLDALAGRADDRKFTHHNSLQRRSSILTTISFSTEPFLNPRNDFHPKRNQARQKLATLPLQRFRDLASDVYYELDRRYPEFGEAEVRTGPMGLGIRLDTNL